MKRRSVFPLAAWGLVIPAIVAAAPLYAQTFTKITGEPIVSDGKGSRSVNFVDYDGDSWPDVFVSNGKSGGENNMLYHNNGDGTFTQITTGPLVSDGRSSDGASFGDYDNNGLIDAAVANWYGQNNLLYRGDSLGYYTQILTERPATDGGFSEACSWADYDLDGDLDLFVANSAGTLLNYLYKNDGDGTFTKVTTGAVVTDAFPSRLGLWGDYDGDGYPDLYVINEGNFNNNLYMNNGDGTFTKNVGDESVLSAGDSFGGSCADIDNDGDLDIYVTNNSSQNNQMFINDGTGTFTRRLVGSEITDGSPSIGSAFADYDNDGDLDLFVANGFTPSNASVLNKLYENDGTGIFRAAAAGDVTSDLGWSYGCAWGDYDRDGDVDLMVARWKGEVENNTLYRNDGASSNHSVSFTCIGTISNNSAIGAKVRALATIGGSPLWQFCEISSQSGYCGQNSLEVEFGLGDATTIDTVIVEWPSGIVDTLTSIAADDFYSIFEGSAMLCQGLDSDRDGYVNPSGPPTSCPTDNCSLRYNPDQADVDTDGIGDVCDTCPADAENDGDADGYCESDDNCPLIANPDQTDTNNDDIGDACCCMGIRGNINGDALESIDIADLTMMVNYMFKSGPTPPCPSESDVNGDTSIDVADVTRLVSYMFKNGSDPAGC